MTGGRRYSPCRGIEEAGLPTAGLGTLLALLLLLLSKAQPRKAVQAGDVKLMGDQAKLETLVASLVQHVEP